MFCNIFNYVARDYHYLEGYLNFASLRGAFALADKQYPDIELKRTPSIISGCYDYGNAFSRELGGLLAGLERDDHDRVLSFCEIFIENHKTGTREAMEKAFDHFAEIHNRFPHLQKRAVPA